MTDDEKHFGPDRLISDLRAACADPDGPLYGSDLVPAIADLCDLVEHSELSVDNAEPVKCPPCDHDERFRVFGAINGCICCQAAEEARLKTEARKLLAGAVDELAAMQHELCDARGVGESISGVALVIETQLREWET